MATIERKILDKVEIVPFSGCWIWTGCLDRKGYGQMNVDGKRIGAHRISYLTFKAPIPAGLTLDHLCRVRCCINPDHLEPVTQRENVLRGDSPCAKHARKTHCKHGHELTEENIYLFRRTRRCRKCYRIAQNKRYWENRS